MIAPVRDQERQCREVTDNLFVCFGLNESLQEFLQYESRAVNVAGVERSPQLIDFGQIGRRIAPQRERPDTGVDKYTQSRDRWDL